jgi:hypothetical protein
MTTIQTATNWAPPRIHRGDPSNYTARTLWQIRHSYSRWLDLSLKLRDRRKALRTANRRYRVHNGLTLKGA